MIKNFKLIHLIISLSICNFSNSVTNYQEEDLYYSQFRSLGTQYYLDQFEGIYPINKNWLITKKFPQSFLRTIHEKILVGSLKIFNFNIKNQDKQYFTVCHYIEYPYSDIALIRVEENLSTEYIKLIDSNTPINEKNWVLISGKKYDPLVQTQLFVMGDQKNVFEILKTSHSSQQTLAAFSAINKIQNNKIYLSLKDKQDFQKWAPELYQTRKNNNFTENYFIEMKDSLCLSQIFLGVPEESDIGGVFLLTNNFVKGLQKNNNLNQDSINTPKNLDMKNEFIPNNIPLEMGETSSINTELDISDISDITNSFLLSQSLMDSPITYDTKSTISSTDSSTLISENQNLIAIKQDMKQVSIPNKTFDNLPEDFDVGNIVSFNNLDNQKITNYNQYQLILVGLIVPAIENNETISTVINLADPNIQEWIDETIFEYEVNNH